MASHHFAAAARRFPSPLRYPGGKGKVANFVKLLFLKNGLCGSSYSEPYAGGASVALTLLFEEYADRIHLNDIDTSVYAFWRCVLDRTDELCGRIAGARISVPEWRRQRAVQQDLDADPVDLAFSTFYLNRTNRSGIIRGGVIGGIEQDGDWKLDARFDRTLLIRRVEKVARYRQRITLTNADAAHYIRDVLPSLPNGLVYLDPPYYVKGARLYRNAYEHADHELIARLVDDIQQRWIVSYDAALPILDLYPTHERIIYNLSYSARDRYRGAEVMFFSPGLAIPEVVSPANITGRIVDRERLAG